MSEPHTLEAGASDPMTVRQTETALDVLRVAVEILPLTAEALEDAQGEEDDVLLDLVDRMRAVLERAALTSSARPRPDEVRRALEFYADEANYRLGAPMDPNGSYFEGSSHARKALAALDADETEDEIDKRIARAGARLDRAMLESCGGPPEDKLVQARHCGDLIDAWAAFRTLLATPSGRPDTPPPGGGAVEQIATDDLVDRFAAALKSKLRASEAKYGWQNGWLKDDWSTDCQRDLLRHVGKGDPLDVAAYAAFCWHHGWKTAAAPEPAAGGGREIDPAAERAFLDLEEQLREGLHTLDEEDIFPMSGQYAVSLSAIHWRLISKHLRSILSAPAHGSAGGEGPFRVGRKVPRHVYEGDEPLFTAASDEAAARYASLLNAGLLKPTPATSSTPAEGK